MSNPRDVVVVSAVRTAVGKAKKGSFKDTRPDDVLIAALKGALARVPALDPADIGDVVIGTAMPEGEQGMNVARIASLGAGLPDSVPAMTINRFCSSGLQSLAQAGAQIQAGSREVAADEPQAARDQHATARHVGKLSVLPASFRHGGDRPDLTRRPPQSQRKRTRDHSRSALSRTREALHGSSVAAVR